MAGAGEPTAPPAGPMEPMPEAMPPAEPMPMAPPAKRITSGGIIAIIGGILMLIVVVLPWVTSCVSGMCVSVNVFDTGSLAGGSEHLMYGIIGLIMGILVIVVVAAKKPILAGIFGIIGLVVFLVAMIRIGWVSESFMGITVSGGPGLGVYLGFIGGILAMIGGFVGHKQM